MDIRELPLASVRVENRLRPVNQAKVAELARSIGEHGQMVPIEVCGPDADGQFTLISGAHRHAACGLANLKTVLASVVSAEMDAVTRELREIDENLYRNDLSPYDYAVFVGRRATLWQQMHGEIKRGGIAKLKSNFAQETADRLALSPDIIKLAYGRMKRGQKNPAMWAALRGTVIAETGVYLDAFLRLDADKQKSLLEAVTFDGMPFQNAFNLVHGMAAAREKTPQQQLAVLMKAWNEAGEVARRHFRTHLNKTRSAASAEA